MKKFINTLSIALTIVFFNFIGYSQASDSYDDNSKTLTIPQVLVGNTTFTNVILKLKEFEVLKYDSIPPAPTATQLTCNNYAAGTEYCNEGKLPTCTVSDEQIDRIASGMTYQQVTQITSCHGELRSRSGPVAIYVWSGTSALHAVGLFNGAVNTVS